MGFRDFVCAFSCVRNVVLRACVRPTALPAVRNGRSVVFGAPRRRAAQRADGDARETRERTDGKSIIMPAREMAVKRPTYAKDGLKSINARGCIIEFVATMTYVALCVPVQMMYGNGFTTAVTYGVVVTLLTYAFRKETVAQMNPSVSVTFMATGKITVEQMIGNIVSQIAGALIGVCWTCVWVAGGNDPTGYVGATLGYWGQANAGRVFFCETVANWLFLVTIVQATHPSLKQSAFFSSIFIGFAYYVCLLFTGSVSGGMINAARSFASACAGSIRIKGRAAPGAVVSTKILWDRHWIAWVAPMAGGAAAIVVDFFMTGFPEKKNTEAPHWLDATV